MFRFVIVLSKPKSIFTAFLLLLAFSGFSRDAELEMVQEYLLDQEVTDICEWKGKIWASTETGLYRLEKEGAIQVAVPVRLNDKITSLYSGSPYTLICGTFQGDLLFITQDNSNYCQAVWSMKDYIKNKSFYVNCVGQNEAGIWLGTLEKGMLLYNPENDSLTQFSFDYNDDSVGLNVDGFEIMKDGRTWTIAQDGLYFIMNIFGKHNELQYVRSNRVKRKPDLLYRKGEQIYLVYKDGGKNKLAKTRFGKHAYDLRLSKAIDLPSGIVNSIEILGFKDIWVLTDKITHVVNDKMIDYYIYPSNKKPFTNKEMIISNDFMYVSTAENGIIKYALYEKKEDENRELKFDPNEITFNRNLELDLVFFSPGDSSLTQTSFMQLDELVKVLETDTEITVLLTGHTARDGQPDFLKKLSMARSKSVRNYLIRKGINESRISVIGKGAEELKIMGNPKSPKNRRVEITLNK